jgi:long-subunit acyl-CoA synthetase (AMP-forming)
LKKWPGSTAAFPGNGCKQDKQPRTGHGFSVVPRIVNKVYDTIQQGVAADPTKKLFFDAAVAEAIKNIDLSEKTKEFKHYDALVFSQVQNVFGGNLKFFVTGSSDQTGNRPFL